MLEITITVDTNDADYNTSVNEISEEDLEKIKPLIAAIRKFKPYTHKFKNGHDWPHRHNYPFGDACREDLGEKPPTELYDFSEEIFEIFEELFPHTEDGFHTIDSITVCPLIEKTILL